MQAKQKYYKQNAVTMEKPTQWTIVVDNKLMHKAKAEAQKLKMSYSDFFNILFDNLHTQGIYRAHKSELLKQEILAHEQQMKEHEEQARLKQKELRKLAKELNGD